MSGRFEYGYNPTAGFVENKDGTVNLIRAGGRRFHPQKLTWQRPSNTFRIFTIGDSVARGGSLASSYPMLIAEELKQRGIKAEAFNLAVPGYGAHRKQIITEQAVKYNPSLIILHVGASNEFEDQREYKRSVEFKSWHPKNWLMKSLVLRRVYEMKTEQVYWNWLPQAVREQRMASDADAELQSSVNPEKMREWDDRVKNHTAATVRLAREHGIPVLLVTQANTIKDPQTQQVKLVDGGLDNMLRPLEGEGVYLLSMRQTFEPFDYAKLFSDGAHMYAKGHQALAKAIADLLLDKNLAR
jgi:lysophospholipase L1-like esterase